MAGGGDFGTGGWRWLAAGGGKGDFSKDTGGSDSRCSGTGDSGKGESGSSGFGKGDFGCKGGFGEMGVFGKGDSSKGDSSKGDSGKGDSSKGDSSKGDSSKGDSNKDIFGKGDAPLLLKSHELQQQARDWLFEAPTLWDNIYDLSPVALKQPKMHKQLKTETHDPTVGKACLPMADGEYWAPPQREIWVQTMEELCPWRAALNRRRRRAAIAASRRRVAAPKISSSGTSVDEVADSAPTDIEIDSSSASEAEHTPPSKRAWAHAYA